MNATTKLLDRYQQTCATPTDKAIAERLRVRQSAVSNWRNGRAHPDAISVEKMAHAISEPVGPWLASIEAERARGDENKRVWLRLAATLGTSAALALMLLPVHVAHAAGAATVAVGAQGRHLHQWIVAVLSRLLTRSFGHALRGIARPA